MKDTEACPAGTGYDDHNEVNCHPGDVDGDPRAAYNTSAFTIFAFYLVYVNIVILNLIIAVFTWVLTF